MTSAMTAPAMRHEPVQREVQLTCGSVAQPPGGGRPPADQAESMPALLLDSAPPARGPPKGDAQPRGAVEDCVYSTDVRLNEERRAVLR